MAAEQVITTVGLNYVTNKGHRILPAGSVLLIHKRTPRQQLWCKANDGRNFLVTEKQVRH